MLRSQFIDQLLFEMSSEPSPIFLIKKELDPFYLYGSTNETQEPDCSDIRVRLAQLRAKNKVALANLYDDQSPDQQKAPPDNLSEKVKPTHKEVRREPTSQNRVIKNLVQIEETFSGVFFNLLKVSKNPLDFIPDGEMELDKILRRRRDFTSRLLRSIFETKQQLNVLRSNLLKLELHPESVQAENLSIQRLSSVLKCVNAMLRVYQFHILHSGGKLYSRAIAEMLEVAESVFSLTDLLGFKVSNLRKDSKRLESFSSTLTKEMKTKFKEMIDEGSIARDETRPDLDLVRTLAREKFGTPEPKTGTKPVSKTKSAKPVKTRSPVKSFKTSSTSREFVNPIQHQTFRQDSETGLKLFSESAYSAKTSFPAKTSIRSYKNSSTSHEFDFTHENAENSERIAKTPETTFSPDLSKSGDTPVMPIASALKISDGNVLQSDRIQQKMETNVVPVKRCVDLQTIHVGELFAARSNRYKCNTNNAIADLLIEKVCEGMIDHSIRKVCKEFFESNVISNLINLELKDTKY